MFDALSIAFDQLFVRSGSDGARLRILEKSNGLLEGVVYSPDRHQNHMQF